MFHSCGFKKTTTNFGALLAANRRFTLYQVFTPSSFLLTRKIGDFQERSRIDGRRIEDEKKQTRILKEASASNGNETAVDWAAKISQIAIALRKIQLHIGASAQICFARSQE